MLTQSLCHVLLSDSLISFAMWRGIKATEHNNDCMCFSISKSQSLSKGYEVSALFIQTNRKLHHDQRWSFAVANENRRKGAAMNATLYFRTF